MLELILQVTGAQSAYYAEQIQTLWSGYGEIVRIGLQGAQKATLILKHVRPPARSLASGEGNTAFSHARKLRSYQVEMAWYRDWSRRCRSRVPACYGQRSLGIEQIILLEDLDAAGFPLRKRRLIQTEIRACLSWLAKFHAGFMGATPDGLWPQGTYWHLETRPDELACMQDAVLRDAAGLIDARLRACRYQTLVHGDAKPANFCFAGDHRVAMVDFQYVGGGSGIQDVAYFLAACLKTHEYENALHQHLDNYFQELRLALNAFDSQLDKDALETEWRGLFPIAWTDFYRFLAGWQPQGYFDPFSQKLAERVIARLGK
ncbi:MAG: phosphotransferase [Candidatus Sericytochromatia bacterium]